MSLVKITDELLERTTVILRPEVHYVSSSAGITGSANVYENFPKVIKAVIDPQVVGQNSYNPDSSTNSGYDEGDYEVITQLASAIQIARSASNAGVSSNNFESLFNRYLEAVNNAPVDTRKNKSINVVRFETPFQFTKNQNIKNNIRKVLMPSYRTRYDTCEFAYTNYSCLNFYTASNVPTGSCLIYPNHTKDDQAYIYSPTGPFTLDFWINPRYTNEPNTVFKAGTIFHLSSSICVSLISGSLKDGNNQVKGFRLLLQLSQSADTPPSQLSVNESLTYPKNLIFSSSDNSLMRNNWHHVTIRWGTKDLDSGQGKIHIDDKVTNFTIPSSSVVTNTDAVFLGNYYDGPTVNIDKFFNSTAEANEGVTDYNDGAYSEDPDPGTYKLSHPLNAEVHDIKLFGKYLFKSELDRIRYKGAVSTDNMLFFVPPFFTPDSRKHDVLQTPFQKINDFTNDPFNVSLSYGVGGFDLNLHNYTKEFVKGEYPRLFELTGSTIDQTIEDITAEEYIYGTIPRSKMISAGATYNSGSNLKKNFTILPCDNGLFKPNYQVVRSPASGSQVNFLGSNDPSIVSLDNLIPTSSLFPGLVFQTGSVLEEIYGASPENPGVIPGAVLTIAQRLRDLSSNQVTVFDISNLYYGNRIHPGTFTIQDSSLTGSQGKIKLTFKDNGRGGLYRADALTEHPKHHGNMGNIFYDEGIALIKTPHAPLFCKDNVDIQFRGEQPLHVLTINAPAGKGLFNSSSNPQYQILSASGDPNDTDRYVYITGVNIHDDNLNVIMRANLAQPILKRETDGVLFKIKKDF